MALIQQIMAALGASSAPLTALSISVLNTTPSVNTSQPITLTATGGTAPYTYKLYTNAGLYGTYSSSDKMYGVSYGAAVGNTYLYATVTDALGVTKTSPTQGISVYYNYGSTASYYWNGEEGGTISLSCTPHCNPAATSYTWYWRLYGGKWALLAKGQNVTSGSTPAGMQHQFYVTTTNAYGSADSNIITVQC